jgi:hypothetical protein
VERVARCQAAFSAESLVGCAERLHCFALPDVSLRVYEGTKECLRDRVDSTSSHELSRCICKEAFNVTQAFMA